MSTLLKVFFNYFLTSVLDKTVSGEGREWGEEFGIRNSEFGKGNGEWGMGNFELFANIFSPLPPLPPKPPKPPSNWSVDARNRAIGFDRNH